MIFRPNVELPERARAIGMLLAALCINGMAHAGNLSFLSNSAASRFNDDDVRIMQTTAFNLLKDGTAGQSQDWANPNSTAKGTITVVKVFKSTEGFACKSLRLENSAGGWHGRSTYAVCQIPPGDDWKIYSGAKPAAAPTP
jgi:surface antigen